MRAATERRFAIAGQLACVLMLLGLVLGVSPAAAGYTHILTGEYGRGGPRSSGLGSGCMSIAFQGEHHRIYLYSIEGNSAGKREEKLYALERTAPGVATEVAGFPRSLGVPLLGGGLGVQAPCVPVVPVIDNTPGPHHIYLGAQVESKVYAFDQSGNPVGGSWPVDLDPSGLYEFRVGQMTVTPTGELWVYPTATGFEGTPATEKFTSSGAPNGTTAIPYGTYDPSSGNLYVVKLPAFGSAAGTASEYTSADGYAAPVLTFPIETSTSSSGATAFNFAQHRLYVTGDSTLRAYDTETGALVEDTEFGARFIGGLAVDEASDVVYATMASSGADYIAELSPTTIPDVSTGEASGPKTVAGHVDPAAGGEVTGCTVEFGTTIAYGSSVPCEPPTGYAGPTDISAVLTGLSGGTLYHYRVSAHNANGILAHGADKTFTPHFVAGLTTEAATAVEKHSATLNASYLGNGEDTHYYFEWGLGTGYGHTTPLEDAGTGGGPQSLAASLSGLESDSTYHYRVIASNGLGTEVGQDGIFSTPKAVLGLATEAASGLSATEATLHGSWTGDATETHYYFAWGFTSLYEHVTALPPGTPAGSGSGPQSASFALDGLAPDTTYHYQIVAANPSGTSVGGDASFTTQMLPSAQVLAPSQTTTESTTLNFTVNPQGTGATTYHVDYGTDAGYGASTPESASVGSDSSDHPASVHLEGLSVGTTYHYRIVLSSPSGVYAGPDQTVTTVPLLPAIEATSASGQTPSSATLEAEVRPGFGSTGVSFDYGTTAAYGSLALPAASLGAGDNAEHPVSVDLTGLRPDTTYHYRVVAVNFAGAVQGPDRTFSTAGPPKVAAGSASAVGRDSATVSALVNPNLSATTYHFQYGTSSSYGSSTAESPVPGADDSSHGASAALSGLAPATTYHFRLLATNSVGTVAGQDGTFTTLPVEPGPAPCSKGKVRRNGRCVKKPHPHHHRRHHRGGHRRG